MDLFVYSDESGVFDYVHNQIFVFGGVIFLSKTSRDKGVRKYISVERSMRNRSCLSGELKACTLSNKHKGKLFRSMNDVIKFGVVINQKRILKSIYYHKKSKQRYLDYAYKIGLKKALLQMSDRGIINLSEIDNIHVVCDEHTTATDGRYELQEGLLMEFKYGTFNEDWQKFFPPICPQMQGITVAYRNSESTTAIRMADIVANRIYYLARANKLHEIEDKVFFSLLP